MCSRKCNLFSKLRIKEEEKTDLCVICDYCDTVKSSIYACIWIDFLDLQ